MTYRCIKPACDDLGCVGCNHAIPEDEHDFDDDGCCRKCGFDGAEWHWWKHSTYEGRAQPDARQPPCKDRQRGE